jgi:hypothetical protein
MGTKLKPSAYDGYAKAESDEPMFILLARDPLAPILLNLWADLRLHVGDMDDKIKEARTVAEEMRAYRAEKLRAHIDLENV